jgi:hypothetical protein
MELFWIVVLLVLVLFIMIVVLPKMFDSQTQAYPITKPSPVVDLRQQQAENRRIADATQSAAALDATFYATQARAEIPVDYPQQPVGSCPFSKAYSRDLPIANMPMCMARSEDNMYLGRI